MDRFVYPLFGDVPTWVLVTGLTVGIVVGLVLASVGAVAAVQQYRHDSYHQQSIRVVEAVSTFVANVGFWLLAAPLVGFVVALFAYVLWPHTLWIAVLLGGLGYFYRYHTRPQ